MIKREKSFKLFEKAKKLMPGGVNSPVRAFRSVIGEPLFIKKGKGSRIWDEDDNEYIDYCCSWGPLILGHAHPVVEKAINKAVKLGTSFGAPTKLENKLAELIISNHPIIERIRFVSSGTEAVMSALRLARGYTGRNKVVKFEGCYHGHVDSLLVKAGSGLVTFGSSSSAGVPEAFSGETLVLPLNDHAAVDEAFSKYGKDIACVIIEPIPANNGLLIQSKPFLEHLHKACTDNGSLLIFDEVISGFRVGFGGAAELYGVMPDIVTLGKIIGGGMPVGAYGASEAIMSKISPLGPVYQAGTLSGNPVAMSAGYAQLKECLKKDFYHDLQQKATYLVDKINAYAQKKGYPLHLFSMGSIFWIAFTTDRIVDRADKIDAGTMEHFKLFHNILLENGVYLGPSGYEVGFVSAAHSYKDLDATAKAMKQALDIVFSFPREKRKKAGKAKT
jgi:glutamate-1-semialdehyde 2,1-aminomutase